MVNVAFPASLLRSLTASFLTLGSASCSLILLALPLRAQLSDPSGPIVPDGSLAEESSRLRPVTETETLIEGGARRGTNLFHSFERFNVGENQTVRFVVPDAGAVERIFSRVSGGEATQILGTLGTTAAADLFLINPNGIFFGPNARLDVRGSFVTTTAESILFENGFAFSTVDPQAPPLLTVNVPIGLQLGQNPAPIGVTGTGQNFSVQLGAQNIPSIVQTILGPLSPSDEADRALSVPAGNTLAFIGGEITFDGGLAVAESGHVFLGGGASSVRIGLSSQPQGWDFNFSGVSQFADINLSNRALVDASGTTAGSIQIIGRNVTLADESIAFVQQRDLRTDVMPGGIDVFATETLHLDRSVISIETLEDGNTVSSQGSGKIAIVARDLVGRNGGTVSSVNLSSRTTASIEIDVSDSIDLRGIFSEENPLLAPFSSLPSRIISQATQTGDSGDISVTAGNIRLVNTGSIGSISSPLLNFEGGEVTADAGDVTILVDDTIEIDGITPGTAFGISQIFSSTFTAGNSGRLLIAADNIFIRNGGLINNAASGVGAGGSTTIIARKKLEATGSGLFSSGELEDPIPNPSSIQAGADLTNVSPDLLLTDLQGESGDLTIATPLLKVNDGAEVSVGNEGLGNGGVLRIFADDVFVGAGAQIQATTLESQGGTIEIQPLAIAELSDVVDASIRLPVTLGPSGARLTLDGLGALISAQVIPSPITNLLAEGDAGSVTISVDEVVVRNGASISVSSPLGGAGILTVNAGTLELEGASLTAVAGNSGPDGMTVGSIELNLSDTLFLRDESTISAEAIGTANGGNVTIKAETVVAAFPATGANGSDIIASAQDGKGGNIDITTQGIFGLGLGQAEAGNQRNDIDPSSEFGLDGTAALNTPEIDPSQGLAALETEPAAAAESKLAVCAAADRFLSQRYRGLPATPDNPIDAIALPWLPAELLGNSTDGHTAEAPLQEATTWQIAANGTVELVGRAPIADAVTLADRARVLYLSGDWAGAAARWQLAAKVLASTGDRAGAATVLGNLSLALQQGGHWTPARRVLAAGEQLLAQAPEDLPKLAAARAELLGIHGQLDFATGNAGGAAARWQEAATLQVQLGNVRGAARSQLARAIALGDLGAYGEAESLLVRLQSARSARGLQSAELQLPAGDGDDDDLEILALQAWASLHRRQGDFAAAQSAWLRSLALARAEGNAIGVQAGLLGLGNLARARGDDRAALEYYRQTLSAAPETLLQIRAQIEQLSLTRRIDAWPSIRDRLESLPLNHASLYARLSLARTLIELLPVSQQQAAVEPLLAVAALGARELGDATALVWALGYRGRLAERIGDLAGGLQFTQQALLLAQAQSAPESVYRWQWQLGRLLAATGDRPGAIATYNRALDALQSLRGELAATSHDAEYAFRTEIEPLYRQYADLLLQPDTSGRVPQAHLREARSVMEALRLAELDNFFHDDCLASTPVAIDSLDPGTAAIYPIVLLDRLVVIVGVAGRPLHYHVVPIAAQDLERTIDEFSSSLVLYLQNNRQPGRQLYEWLVRPAEAWLEDGGVETLVWIPDGRLREIAPAALSDGQRYLIEKFDIALSPGLTLLPPERQVIAGNASILTAGLSEARQGFAPLPAVSEELQVIAAAIPNHRQLFNETFTDRGFASALKRKPTSILHLATHGQFGGSAEETFILTWNERIGIVELGQLLERRDRRLAQTLELLVLSACSTATGDDRAALGIAGVAVRSGARSTLAGLWPLNDEATAAFMAEFYQALTTPGTSRAQAVRRAQLALMQNPRYAEPFLWAPFVLVGNWL